MFATLSDRLADTFKNLRGKGRLSEADIDATAREIRIALLEADVALPVVKEFVGAVKERARGEEVSQALRDLHDAGCELITITQYLRPSVRHHPVERWVKPEEFVELAAEAEDIGFAGVMSGPLVRSSYRAGRLYRQAMDRRAVTTA